jgi:cell division protein FtsX
LGLERKLVDYLARNPSLLVGYCDTLDELARDFSRAGERQWATYRAARADPNDRALRRAAEAATEDANMVDAVTRQVLLSAQLYLLRQKAGRWGLIIAALLAASGIVLFAWAANPGS